MGYKVGDFVLCTHSISAKHGGPKKGQYFKIISVENSSARYYNLDILGIKCPDYMDVFDNRNYDTIKNGTEPNWHSNCFKKVNTCKLLEVLLDLQYG